MSEMMKQALTNKDARNTESLALVAAGDIYINFSFWA